MPVRKQVFLSLCFCLLVTVFLISFPVKSYSGIMPVIPAVGCCISGDSCVGCGSGCAILESDCTAAGGTSETDNICVNTDSFATCQEPDGFVGCCVISLNNCTNQIDYFTCNREALGIAWYQGSDCTDVPQCHAPSNIPALGEWSGIALVVVLGIAGLIYFTRRIRMTSV